MSFVWILLAVAISWKLMSSWIKSIITTI
jgi:hypothetical protein